MFPLALPKAPFSTLWSLLLSRHQWSTASVCNFSPDLTSDIRFLFSYLFDSSVYGHFTVNISNIEPVMISLPTPKILAFFQFSVHDPYSQLCRHTWDSSLPQSINIKVFQFRSWKILHQLTALTSTANTSIWATIILWLDFCAGLLTAFLLSLLPPSQPFSSHQQEIYFWNENLTMAGWGGG